ncbi:hypothetical protein EIN_447720, partial [Entamoeba invadens IP1]
MAGEIVFDALDNQAVLNVNRFEVNTTFVQSAKDQCITPIIRKAFTNGEPMNIDAVPELVWKGSVTFTEQGQLCITTVGFQNSNTSSTRVESETTPTKLPRIVYNSDESL